MPADLTEATAITVDDVARWYKMKEELTSLVAAEAMLCKRPMVVAYKVSALKYRLVKGLGMLKVERYALPNVLAGETLVPELMQQDCTPENLAGEVLRWLRDPTAVAALQPRFRELHLALRRDASARAADAISEFLQ